MSYLPKNISCPGLKSGPVTTVDFEDRVYFVVWEVILWSSDNQGTVWSFETKELALQFISQFKAGENVVVRPSLNLFTGSCPGRGFYFNDGLAQPPPPQFQPPPPQFQPPPPQFQPPPGSGLFSTISQALQNHVAQRITQHLDSYLAPRAVEMSPPRISLDQLASSYPQPYPPQPSLYSQPYPPQPYPPQPYPPQPYPPQPVSQPYPPQPVSQPYPPQPVSQPYPPQPVVQPSPPKPVVQPSPPKPVVQPSPPKPVVQPSPPKPAVQPSPPKPVAQSSPPKPVVQPSPPKPVVQPSPPRIIPPRTVQSPLRSLPVRYK